MRTLIMAHTPETKESHRDFIEKINNSKVDERIEKVTPSCYKRSASSYHSTSYTITRPKNKEEEACFNCDELDDCFNRKLEYNIRDFLKLQNEDRKKW